MRLVMVQRSGIESLVEEERVHRQVYVDPGIFEEELRRLFYRVWVFVGHESEVTQPGDYKTTFIGRQPVIMTRHTSGQIFVLFNRCAHRGAVVCREERGRSKEFRCIYHGWVYDTSGELIGVPYQAGYGEDFKTEALGLGRVARVDSYRGFVFGCLAPEGESLETYLGPAKRYIDVILDRAPEGAVEVTKGVQKYAYRGNWKLQLENFVDSYHPAFTHESSFERFRARTGRPGGRGDQGGENVYLGHGHSLIDYDAAPAGPTVQAELPLPEVGAQHIDRAPARGRMNLAIFPNLLLYPNGQHLRVIRPVRVDYTEVFAYPYRLKGVAEAENNKQVQQVSIWAGAAGLGQPDDIEAFERIQEGLAVESMEWVLFNRGLQRERIEPSGERRGLGADEVAQRGQHREYKRLTLEP